MALDQVHKTILFEDKGLPGWQMVDALNARALNKINIEYTNIHKGVLSLCLVPQPRKCVRTMFVLALGIFL